MELRQKAMEAYEFSLAVKARDEQAGINDASSEIIELARAEFERVFGPVNAAYWAKTQNQVIITTEDGLEFLSQDSLNWAPRLIIHCASCGRWYETSFAIYDLARLGEILAKEVGQCGDCEEEEPTLGDRLEEVIRDIVKEELPTTF